MYIAIGIIVIIASIYFLVKQYDSRMVLFTAGAIMAIAAGDPMQALDAFAKRMTSGGLIMAICSVMGFAFVMKVTKCDQHLIKLVAKGLKKFRPVIVPGAALATFAINIALPSASGTAAAVGAIFIPILIGTGIHPALAASAVKAGTFGSLLNPGLSHNPFVADLAGVSVMEVIANHSPTVITCAIISAVALGVLGKITKEDNVTIPVEATAEENGIEKANFLYAMVPLFPLIILILGASVVPSLKMGVAQAMVIGTVAAVLVTRIDPSEISREFFHGMGVGYSNIMGIIIAAAVFVSGLKAIGLVDAFINALVSSDAIVKVAATFGPFLLAIISGSGDAASFAFNEAVTPHAAEFGLRIMDMGSMAALGGALGRTLSPITGATIVVAGIAGVNPMEVAKRNVPGMIIAAIVAMFILL